MKKKKKKIGSLALVAIAVVAVFAGIEFVVAPGIISSFFLTFGEANPYCGDAPYNPSCVCNSDENKKGVAWNGIQTETNPMKYYCENVDLLLDPDSPTFEQDALSFANNHLTSNYPECDSINACPVEPEVGVGYTNFGKRFVTVQCREIDAGRVLTFWHLYIDIEEEITSSSCMDLTEFEPEEGAGTMEVNYYKEGPGYNLFELEIRAECVGKEGAVSDSYTYTLDPDKPDATDWWFHSMYRDQTKTFCGEMGTCYITNKLPRSVTIHCEATCTGYGDCTSIGDAVRYSTIISITCGNGILETGEQCDDGNTLNGDGCSSSCLIE